MKQSDERIAFAKKRIFAARTHLNTAREHLDAACRDVCALIGGNAVFRDISALSGAARDASYKLDELAGVRWLRRSRSNAKKT